MSLLVILVLWTNFLDLKYNSLPCLTWKLPAHFLPSAIAYGFHSGTLSPLTCLPLVTSTGSCKMYAH